MTDAYQELGEFHDLFMSGPWTRLAPALTDAFSELTASDVVLDLGAGTGVGTRVLAAATRAQIVAIEPSLTMRAALLTRVDDDPRLRDRVSVVAGAVPEALADVGPVASGSSPRTCWAISTSRPAEPCFVASGSGSTRGRAAS